MHDEYGRVFQCPKCDSTNIRVVHIAFASKGRLRCEDCGYQARHEYFKAIPEDAIRYNPSRRYG